VDLREQIDHDGFAVVPTFGEPPTPADLLAGLQRRGDTALAGEAQKSPHGLRNLLRLAPTVRALAQTLAQSACVTPILGAGAFPVRALFFDKPTTANWKVPWHQDLSIAVHARVDMPGFGPWSIKAGIPHVQPPVALLERMLAVRVHLDECDDTNGPLQVIPGSHRHGRLDPAAIRAWRARVAPVTCLVPRGGLLLMRPLLLHASSAAQRPEHRRVIHLEFAAEALPGELAWAEA
jgi:ectoine hydroxylase-related dioxygenase (phytanoyl-CoA dioxygenase family)